MSLRRIMLFMLAAKITNQIQYFKSRVSADLGLFEAESCLNTQLNTINNQNLLDSASLIVTPNAYKTNKLYSVVPFDATGDMTFTRATSATRVNSAGLIESVGNNIARIDYTNASCPSILVEPQRTNLFLQSEDFTNVGWGKGQSSVVANSVIAPDGTLTADTFIVDGTSAQHAVSQAISTTSGVVYTISVFAKKNTNNFLQIAGFTAGFGSTPAPFVNFDLNNGTLGTVSANASGSIQNYGNGWYRCVATFTATATASAGILFFMINSASSVRGEVNVLSTSVYLWGAQVEVGSNTTSYIPTTTTSVTRNADVMTLGNLFTKNIVTSTGGSWYIELINERPLIRTTSSFTFYIGDSTSGSVGNSINIRNNAGFAENLGIDKFINGARTGLCTLPNGNPKILINWNGSTANIFINGNKVISNTTFPATNLQFLSLAGTDVSKNIKNVMIFPLPLTDQQAIQLTTL